MRSVSRWILTCILFCTLALYGLCHNHCNFLFPRLEWEGVKCIFYLFIYVFIYFNALRFASRNCYMIYSKHLIFFLLTHSWVNSYRGHTCVINLTSTSENEGNIGIRIFCRRYSASETILQFAKAVPLNCVNYMTVLCDIS